MSEWGVNLDGIIATTRGTDETSGGPAGTSWDSAVIWNHSLLVIGFGILTLVLIGLMIIFSKKEAIDILRVCSLPLIITASVYLIVVGYSRDQIYPVITLLGAIAGYLLGSIGRKD